jgi:hypothetical protein
MNNAYGEYRWLFSEAISHATEGRDTRKNRYIRVERSPLLYLISYYSLRSR